METFGSKTSPVCVSMCVLVCAGIATHGDIERIRVVLRTFVQEGTFSRFLLRDTVFDFYFGAGIRIRVKLMLE